jgi:hypothetical protein
MAQIVDGPRTQLDNTVRVFDSFYNFDISINANEYEIVRSYFMSVSENADIADNFTTMLFRISSITDQPALILLEYIQGTTKLETTALMAYYLNSIKSKTTLYGVTTTPVPNENIQRNVVI